MVSPPGNEDWKSVDSKSRRQKVEKAMETSKFPSSLLSYKTPKDEVVFLSLMDDSHLGQVEVLGKKAW